jgi:hypothetical protein
MNIIGVVLVLIVIGFLVYLAERFVPMSEPIRTIFRVVVGLAVVIWLLQWSGLLYQAGLFRR